MCCRGGVEQEGESWVIGLLLTNESLERLTIPDLEVGHLINGSEHICREVGPWGTRGHFLVHRRAEHHQSTPAEQPRGMMCDAKPSECDAVPWWSMGFVGAGEHVCTCTCLMSYYLNFSPVLISYFLLRREAAGGGTRGNDPTCFNTWEGRSCPLHGRRCSMPCRVARANTDRAVLATATDRRYQHRTHTDAYIGSNTCAACVELSSQNRACHRNHACLGVESAVPLT